MTSARDNDSSPSNSTDGGKCVDSTCQIRTVSQTQWIPIKQDDWDWKCHHPYDSNGALTLIVILGPIIKLMRHLGIQVLAPMERSVLGIHVKL